MDIAKIERERERLQHYQCPAKDPRQHPPSGVLLSDEIKHYVHSFKLVDPFTEDNLKAAGYELTIGDEFVIGGNKKDLNKDGEIRIPPFNVVVIKTAETINLPRFLIARWNVRVKWAYEGLLWVGAAQVDPGWVGHLFCPIYNLSAKEVVIRAGDPIALMDFVTTSEFKPGESRPYPRPPKRLLLEEYNATELKSALYTEAKQRIDDIDKKTEKRLESLSFRIDAFVTITFASLGILFAAGVFFVTDPNRPHWWNTSVFWICVVSIALSGLALVRSRYSDSLRPRTTEIILWLALLGLIGVGFIKQEELKDQINEMRSQIQNTSGSKSQQNSLPSATLKP
jgi:deoxycytidine triphosphate deaminase